ncbi:MAG: beta-CASP ribonuclease aCPSF1 [Candidatus Aenigmarchaeota archaeon]|nr:beta-CASP ribonuclease aCPSF1 [Candidatus Aenigmarchaeota archaeon]
MNQKELKAQLPKSADITNVCYEGSELIVYTKNKDYFKTCTEDIKKIVNTIKKRIEVRADPSIIKDPESTQELIKKLVPEEAGIKDIYFETEFAKVVIHAEKPGLVIGKNGETLNTIKEKTLWTPEIKRAPVIDSEIVRSVRKMLHKEADYRKKFLNDLGSKIYEEGKPVEWLRIATLGAFQEVGRSCILVQTPQSSVLLDCGLATGYGHKDNPFPYLSAPEFHIQDLDAVILTHAHTDHAGLIPYLYEYGYRGPVYCTEPTRDLAALLQLDYIQICQRENSKPYYSSKAIEEFVKHAVCLNYGEVSDITPDMRLTLQNAGHILGSSSVHLHVGDGFYNLVYTGDLKYEHDDRLMERAFTGYTRMEALILESTYGKKSPVTLDYSDAEKELLTQIKKTIDRGGRVIIPAFAVGRSQNIIAALAENDINVPVYLDGMIWDATGIYTAYPEFLSKKIQTLILHKAKNPFIDPRIKGIGSSKERQEVMNSVHPAVILTTSGMLQGGPVMEYLHTFSHDPKNMLIFVGYQAEGTTGRRIQKGWKRVQLDNGKEMELNLEIVTIEGFSDHNYQHQTLKYFQDLKCKPKKIILNHGESSSCIELARTLHNIFKIETVAPKNLEIIRLK